MELCHANFSNENKTKKNYKLKKKYENAFLVY